MTKIFKGIGIGLLLFFASWPIILGVLEMFSWVFLDRHILHWTQDKIGAAIFWQVIVIILAIISST